jgi:hypothetical protein
MIEREETMNINRLMAIREEPLIKPLNRGLLCSA